MATNLTTEAYKWNNRQRSVLESNKYMFENKVVCDVTFLIQYPADGQPTRIPAHKYVLFSRSPVFFAQFCGTAAPLTGDVLIDDMPAEDFTEMLRLV